MRSGYLHRTTGEVFVAFVELLRLIADGEEIEGTDYEDADEAERAKHRSIVELEDWIPLPTCFDLDEYETMVDFARGRPEHQADRLLDQLNGKGAFRRFKDAVHRLGIQDDWHAFRDEAIRQYAVHWLEAHDIPYQP